MRLDEKRLEQSTVGLNLSLQFLICLRPHARLIVVRDDVVDVCSPSVRPENSTVEPAFLQAHYVLRVADGACSTHGQPAHTSRSCRRCYRFHSGSQPAPFEPSGSAHLVLSNAPRALAS